MIRYFAYGSNLCIEQMSARIGPFPVDVEPPRIARLAGYRLAFNMRGENGQVYANIVRPGEFVLGVLYTMAPEALDRLDAFEAGYHREQIVVTCGDADSVDAIAYIANPENVLEGGRPNDEYIQKILRGGRRHGLPSAYLHSVLQMTSPSPCQLP